MKHLPTSPGIILAASLLAAAPALADHVRDGGTLLTATLTGAAERPGPGDPDGTGNISITINPGQKRICYELTIAGIATPSAAHIHIAPPTAAGPVVVGFPAPPLGASSGCIDVTSKQAAQLIAKPSDYYFNVHNSEFPAGAIRGQLSRHEH